MTVGEKDRLLIQAGIWGDSYIEPVFQSEHRIRPGNGAWRIPSAIARVYPEIAQFGVIAFDPMQSSDDSDNGEQSIIWIDRQWTTGMSLRKLSEALANCRKYVDFVLENGREVSVGAAMAVTSLVKLADGTFRHIFQMDYAVKIGPANLAKVIKSEPGMPGFAVQTDRSYHRWGAKLLKPFEWQSLMEELSDQEEGLQRVGNGLLYDDNFIKVSRERGFSALRVLGYPLTYKSEDPRVVAVL